MRNSDMENEKKEWPAELLELFDDPLLEGVKPKAPPITADDRMQKKIEELREWIEANGHEPDVNSKNIREKLMAVSLKTLKEKGLWI